MAVTTALLTFLLTRKARISSQPSDNRHRGRQSHALPRTLPKLSERAIANLLERFTATAHSSRHPSLEPTVFKKSDPNSQRPAVPSLNSFARTLLASEKGHANTLLVVPAGPCGVGFRLPGGTRAWPLRPAVTCQRAIWCYPHHTPLGWRAPISQRHVTLTGEAMWITQQESGRSREGLVDARARSMCVDTTFGPEDVAEEARRRKRVSRLRLPGARPLSTGAARHSSPTIGTDGAWDPGQGL